ncbi:kinase-like domain-containing protein [Paraphoma chrysanthemicola]|uniref:Kinase-like domain-containing protein n=1 Tax=Paraphoma chrysanthemicola TaxID=798071 RepID=A0A8K0VV94_9PLEO|nr:kinase-like domain-containing protein [Paraphoma chrysanthemicola]
MDQASEDLKLCLKKLRVKNADRRRFIPGLRLCEVLSETAIRQALLAAQMKLHTVDEAVKYILKQGIRIFAILVLIEQVAATLTFIERGELQDHRLPFKKKALRKLLPETGSAIDDFEESQWEVIAPSFFRGAIHRSLRKAIVLPFIKDEHIGNGAFGKVSEIALHPDHQDLEDSFRRKLVRKALDNAADHRVELDNLAILSHLRHPNIVELLASYTHNEIHNLIFPFAEGGTLEKLFELEPETTAFKTKSAFFIAMADLASAIEHVHNFTESRIDMELMGCHYDLRPKNILVSGDTLVLADFGLSRFKALSEESATNFKMGALDYQAPECEDIDGRHFQKHKIHRSSDIWSFGCVLAEVITYTICGSIGVRNFRDARRFKIGQGTYRYFHQGPNQQNKAVSDWLSQLILKSSRSEKMLVNVIQQMLSLDEKKRPKAKEVTGRLRLIAMYEVSRPANELFNDYSHKNISSLDALIEYTRFRSWQYALGLLEQQCTADLAIEVSAWHLSEFKATLDNMKRIQEVLETLSAHLASEAMIPLYRLTELNNRLDEILSDSLRDRSQLYFKTFILQSKEEPALQQIQDSLPRLPLPTEVRMRAALKYMTQLAMWHSERDTCHTQLDVKRIKIKAGFGEHSIGSFFGDGASEAVLVEWREYGRQSADEAVQNELLVRADAIAEMLSQEKPTEFCALDCKGFYHDLQRSAFGLVFSYPTENFADQCGKEPESLHGLLVQTSEISHRHPTLDDRFWIAYKLCRSVLEFHLVGWLHKRLSSSNVLFFPTSENLDDDWFRVPYVVGFNHSRPDDVSAFTGGPESSATNHYQHPSYFVKRRYCAEYDYYSLGVVLLEIGLWAPLSRLIRKQQGSYEEIRQYLITKRLPILKKSMGRQYYEAVKMCLQAGMEGSELGYGQQAPEAKSLSLQFSTIVVERMANLVDRF